MIELNGGGGRNRTGVHGFAGECGTTGINELTALATALTTLNKGGVLLARDNQTVTTFIPSDLALSVIASSRENMPWTFRLPAMAR